MDNITRLSDIVDPQIVEIFDQTKDQLSSELRYGKLGFEDYSPSIPNPSFSSISGLSVAQLTLEGAPYSNEDRTQGYDVSITVQKYTKMCTYTEELIHWIMEGNKEKAQEFREGVEAVHQSLYERVDTQAARLLYLAHTTTHQTGGDGVSLANASHTSTDSGVAAQRNIPPTSEGHVPLSYTAVVNARNRMNRFYDLKGVQLKRSRNLKLLISLEQEDLVKRLLYTPKLPGTELNDNNTLSGITYEVVDWQPSGYSSYWALVDAERMKRSTKMIWGWKPRVMSETEYKNGTFYKPGSVYVQSGFRDWHWGYFSKGDSSAS
jgi:hypothetical protein